MCLEIGHQLQAIREISSEKFGISDSFAILKHFILQIKFFISFSEMHLGKEHSNTTTHPNLFLMATAILECSSRSLKTKGNINDYDSPD